MSSAATGMRDSIFVSVAAYCDPMLGFTLRSAMSQADDPGRVYIGVVCAGGPAPGKHTTNR